MISTRLNEANRKRWHWIVAHVYGRILDCGSGSGETWSQTGFQGDVILVDLACYKPTPYPFVWADLHNLPFRDKAFDCCVLSEVLEHVASPERALSEAIRVCKERVVITIPDECNFDPEAIPFRTRKDHLEAGEY